MQYDKQTPDDDDDRFVEAERIIAKGLLQAEQYPLPCLPLLIQTLSGQQDPVKEATFVHLM